VRRTTTSTTPVARPRRRSARDPRDESGFALIELVVSAMIMVTIAGGALAAIQATNRSGAEERHRAQAYALAQEDQARMRALKVSELSNLSYTRNVIEDGTTYTITSKGEFVTDSTGTTSCTQGTAAADYIRATSNVTWPTVGARPPVLVQSIVAPPNGAISIDSGALAISVQNGQGQGLAGVGLSGSGAGSFSGTTGSNGCVIFGNLPAGNYTLTPSAPGLVDTDGAAPQAQATSVVGLSTNTVALLFDDPGTISASFTIRTSSGLVAAKTDSVMAFNTGMTAAKRFGTVGTPISSVSAGPLFPFASPDTFYAGTCTGDNPNPSGSPTDPGVPATASVVVPAGTSANATFQLPKLIITVRSGTGSGSPGSLVSGATVRVADLSCPNAPTAGFKRTFTTNSQGTLADPGLPYSNYDVCVGNATKHKTVTNVSVKNLTSTGTVLSTFYLGTSVGTNGWVSGACPS
jgi:Tfp pilus assembly protein PilV